MEKFTKHLKRWHLCNNVSILHKEWYSLAAILHYCQRKLVNLQICLKASSRLQSISAEQHNIADKILAYNLNILKQKKLILVTLRKMYNNKAQVSWLVFLCFLLLFTYICFEPNVIQYENLGKLSEIQCNSSSAEHQYSCTNFY